MNVVASIMHWRPFLWLWVLAVAAVLVSMTWEGATSYDDGGIGTLSFFLLATIGAPFLLGVQLFGWAFETGRNATAYYALGLISLTVHYLGLDLIASAWLRHRKPQPAHSNTGTGA